MIIALLFISLSQQFTLLSGCSSQVVLSTDYLEDGGGKIVLGTGNGNKSSNKVPVVPGLGVDIATIDLTNIDSEGGSGDIVSDQAENGEVTKPECLTFSLATTIRPPSTSKQNHQPNSPRRGPGRPRREDTEVDPPIGKVFTYYKGHKIILQSMCLEVIYIILNMNSTAALDN